MSDTGPIEVYGKIDCADTQRARALLDERGVLYRFHDVLSDDALRLSAVRLGGGGAVPVVVFPSGTVQVEPADAELLTQLQRESPGA